MSKHFVRRGIFWTSIVLGLTASSIVTAQQRPVPTSDRTVPRPPAIPGCYTLSRIVTKDEAPRWKKAECASPEELSHLPHPTFGGSLGTPGIQTQSKSFPLLPALFPQHPASFSATPGLANGAASVQFPLQESWTVTDSASGNTSFSVQLNTNIFSATCHSSNLNFPLFPVPCTNGDFAAVQFTFQTANAGVSQDYVCIWNVDVTKQFYNFPQTWQACVGVGKMGLWPSTETINISGYVDFENHNIILISGLPWSTEWQTVVTPDWFGLCWTPGQFGSQCSWNQVSGTILGYAGGSAANFGSGTSVLTIVQASTCSQYTPAPVCNFQPSIFSSAQLQKPNDGVTTLGFGTAETNNLNGVYLALPTATCGATDCTVSFTGTAP
jgi:hypothetical protein